MMEFVNEANKWETVPHSIAKRFVLLLSPFAPHVAEELWQKFGGTKTISFELWPTYDENKLMSDTIMLAVQVNGKVRDTIEVAIDLEEAAIKGMALGTEKIQKWLEGKEPKKVIYVKGKLVSVVV
ncbi:MAG: leucyl-tRNA synthetase [Candidatus Magasanikbacteria bacterium CG10_big_fil_rev_8_21_14_0_10_38_6]|uniref:leucine--tRNA ligase n=1 Tax=Candidatus Magasanikbacteria bacterium CG10_big_fil_rev_8_21_14_0_10_38_6 TaxID=1974647 RepID=A0A2M6P0S2_9BACT|nr:MAG: leucyl-tRNA synthetase [Candidatus Magasanikbacteria bacterium CG10_big_fil_rev_8_21_14_0_10_38_6]